MKEQAVQDNKDLKIEARLLVCNQQWIFYHDPSENKYNWIQADCAITSNILPINEIYRNDGNNSFIEYSDLCEQNQNKVLTNENSIEKVKKETKNPQPE